MTNEFFFFLDTEIPEKYLIDYFSNLFNKKIASLNRLEKEGDLYSSYFKYNGEVKVMFSLAWPLDTAFVLNTEKIVNALALEFNTNVYFTLPDDEDKYSNYFWCIGPDMSKSKVTFIEDEKDEDLIYIKSKNN